MSENLLQVTLVFLRKDDKILLAMKKRGFGEGYWNGVGGKPDPGESIEETAIRECEEEICVTPESLSKVAVLNFYSPKDKHGNEQDMQAHVFFCDDWEGEPTETEEMRPKWFLQNEIPYTQMWSDDIYWLPRVLDGEQVEGDFYFDDNNEITKHRIRPLVIT